MTIMKDKLYWGLLSGLLAPFLVVLLLYAFRFRYLSLPEFISQAFFLQVHLKLVAIGVFFADLGLFYLFLYFHKNNASKGVILSVMVYFFLMLFSSF